MKEILDIRKSLLVNKILKQKLSMNNEGYYDEYSNDDFDTFQEIMKRIKDNLILQKSPLNLDSYELDDLKPEVMYLDRRYNVNQNLEEASQIQKKLWKLSSLETITERGIAKELKDAPFSYNLIRQTDLDNTFGIPLLCTSEITPNEGNIMAKQQTYNAAVTNQMSYANSEHQDKLEKLISSYKDLKNFTEDELLIYNGTMRCYQDNLTFSHYLSHDATSSNSHYFYFKTGTLDSFIEE